MKSSEFITEVTIDNVNGIGATPDNSNVDYFGLRVTMKPLTFLRMATELTVDSDTEKRILAMAQYLRDGGAVGSPFLTVDIPDEWEDGNLTLPARIVSHEGRHRMEAILKAEGNNPVEVHIFFPGLRRRDITDAMISRLNQSIVNQRTALTSGPWFSLTLAEAVTETVNNKVFFTDFNQKKPILDGKYVLVASAGYVGYGSKNGYKSEQFRIVAKTAMGVEVGWVNFENKGGKLEALDLSIQPAHRRKGIATEMYKFARELGNDIAPSKLQTSMGKQFWSQKNHSN